MKTTLLIVMALLLVSCSPVAQPAPTATASGSFVTAEWPAGAPSTATATQTMTAILPSETPLPTNTPEATPSPPAIPLTEPVIAARFPMHMGDDGLGFGSTLVAMPGGQVWETTLSGGVRVYDSESMTVLKSLALEGKENSFSRLVGDEQYVWALFYNPSEGPASANLFRISRADYSVQPVDLPGTCTYEACQWSYLLLDGDILWVGGYDELWAFDREKLEPVTKFLYSEQAKTFFPSQVLDLDVSEDGKVWSLFCTDTCYIVILDRQKLLDNMEQEQEMISFVNSSVQFVASVGGTMWAGEGRSGNVEVQPAVLYRLDETGVQLSPEDGIELTDELDFYAIDATNIASDGIFLWVLNEGGRKLFWFDPKEGSVAGVLQVYPGDEPTSEDPFMLMSISFDGQHLWAGGAEILRIAMPWIE